MDPFSLFFTVLAIYGILQRRPQLGGEAVQEFRAGRRGEISPAAAELQKRLADGGIEPATGGPMRQYLGNVWRDYWREREEERQAEQDRKATEAEDEAANTWRKRIADRLDDETYRRASQWRAMSGRGRPGGESDSDTTTDDEPDGIQSSVIHDSDEYKVRPPNQDGNTTAGPNSAPPQERDPIRVDATVGDPIRPHAEQSRPRPTGSEVVNEQPDTYEIKPSVLPEDFDPDGYITPPPRPAADSQGSEPAEPRRGPIRVDATTGDPIRNQPPAPSATAVITAGGTMSTIAQQNVTGVVSGAAEARAIERQIDNATAAYVAQLAQIRARIHALGDSTLGIVQMSARSRVIALTATAAESAAAAQANAKACGGEVGPLLGAVAKEFNRINS